MYMDRHHANLLCYHLHLIACALSVGTDNIMNLFWEGGRVEYSSSNCVKFAVDFMPFHNLI